MTLGLLGFKKEMTQIFDQQGLCIPVTLIQAGPCVVVLKKDLKSDGYHAIQLGFSEVKENRLNKAKKGHFQKRKIALLRHLKEFRIPDSAVFELGQTLTAEHFKPGDHINVEGITKGRGFQGVMKKEGKHGGPDAHGSDFHRRPGSIGQRTWPGKVMKNMGMPGRMGADRVTIKNLKVIDVKVEHNLLLVEGSVPGAKNGLLVIYKRSA